MAAYFVDLDGTVFLWGTETPLPGAIKQLSAWQTQGHELIFVTQRDRPWAEKALQALAGLGIRRPMILSDISSPRTMINDQGAFAVNHPINAPWRPL